MSINYISYNEKIVIEEASFKPKFRFAFKNFKEVKEKLPELLKITLNTNMFTIREATLILQNTKSTRDFIKKINAILKAYNM